MMQVKQLLSLTNPLKLNNMTKYTNIPLYYIVTTYGNYIGYWAKGQNKVADKQFTLVSGIVHNIPAGENIEKTIKTGTNIHIN